MCVCVLMCLAECFIARGGSGGGGTCSVLLYIKERDTDEAGSFYFSTQSPQTSTEPPCYVWLQKTRLLNP